MVIYILFFVINVLFSYAQLTGLLHIVHDHGVSFLI